MNPTTVKPWTVTASRYLLKDKWLTVRADQCQTAQGVTVDPYYVLEYPDWVQVAAFDADGRVLVTQQYRHAAGLVCLELPCGVVEETDETPLAAAVRELLEETGYTSNYFELVGRFSPNPATHTNTLHCFAAHNAYRSQETSQDETEDVSCGFLTVEDILSALETGRFSQALHISSLLLTLKHVGAMVLSDKTNKGK